MEIRMKGKTESLTENGLYQVLSEKRKEEIALRHEANRTRKSAIKRAKTQLIIAAVMGETHLYLPLNQLDGLGVDVSLWLAEATGN